ncbi:tail fiber domain-containing protein [Pseudomonas sp. LRF_L74]|uniref:tail fiber domain-containing protein n=1 Tax=Pseudomonas sp. LRF_L74 TaxID=3369422 RepID=UPI003F631223
MAWYSTGTVTVAASGTTATGSGTAFLGNVRVGDGITIAGSNAQHEVTGVTSDTVLTFAPAYAGSAGSGKTYRVAPMLGYDKDLSDAFNTIRLNWGTQLSAMQLWAYAASASVALDNLGASASGKTVFTDTPANGRTALGLGTASTASTGTSGATVPLLNGTNTVSGLNTFTSAGIRILNAAGGVWYQQDESTTPGIWNVVNGGYLAWQRRVAGWGTAIAAVMRIPLDSSGGGLQFNQGPTPAADNTISMATAALRFTQYFAATATIGTSDAREKTEVRKLTEAELNWAIALADEIGAYQWLYAIEEKGNWARDHIGMTVQRAIELGESFGLEPFNYGFICFDQWPTKTIEHAAQYEINIVPATYDEQGNLLVAEHTEQGELISEAWVETVQTEGDRYSFRGEGLQAFIIAGLAEQGRRDRARLAAIELALNITH